MQPERVGPYLIEKKIGAGGMGTVYYARHAETHEEAAIKVLPASLAREEGFVARFYREIDAMKQLVDPRIVKLYESGVDGETYYYAMEYVDGETLTSRLRRDRRIPWRETIEIAIQICAALKAAHAAGIVHRDLKPSNLLISKNGTVKLTDFGVAQVFAGTKLTVTGGIIGTAEYMSPEQAEGKRATKKSDLYSLGAVMYVMLTGRPPFRGKTTLDVIQQQKYGQFDRPIRIVPEIPHWLDEIVVQLLEKDPDKRFADAFVLMRRLQEVLAKVDLANSDRTEATTADDGTAPTVAIDPQSRGPIGGTLMRDLVRAELENANRRSPIGEAFNNTWVLVAMLVLVIVGGVAWFKKDRTPPVEESQVTSDEGRMFLKRAENEMDTGELAKAEQTLLSLKTLVDHPGGDKALLDRINRNLEKLQERRAGIDQGDSLRSAALKRADQLMHDDKAGEARKVRDAVLQLYGDDSAAPPASQKAEKHVEQKPPGPANAIDQAKNN